MHLSVMQWVQHLVSKYDLQGGKILECGSLVENGSVRAFFDGAEEYIGVDMRPGQGVDMVALAHNLPFTDDSFDLVISTEMLEHDEQFWLSLPEMGRVLKTEGMMVLTARGNGFPHHAYPNDFWRFMPGAGPVLLRLAGCRTLESFEDPLPGHPGIFCLGKKNPTKPPECNCWALNEGGKHHSACAYGQWLLAEEANQQLRDATAPKDLT